MARAKSVYVCSECGASALQWFGTCPACGAAGTLSETIAERASGHRYAAPAPAAAPAAESSVGAPALRAWAVASSGVPVPRRA